MQCGKLEAFSRQLFGNPREGSTKRRKTKYNKVHKTRAMQLGEQASKQALDNNSNRRRSDYMKFAIIFIIIIIAITLSPRLSAAFIPPFRASSSACLSPTHRELLIIESSHPFLFVCCSWMNSRLLFPLKSNNTDEGLKQDVKEEWVNVRTTNK